jgi:uncharacterized phage protein gp47/JayE
LSYDVEAIHGQMLEAISDEYQKSIGFPAWDITRAFALAVCSLGDDVNTAVGKTDVDTLSGDELSRWCAQRRGITRRAAVAASGTVTIVAGQGVVNIDNLFESGGGIQFRAIESKKVTEGDTVAVEAVIPGISGNVAANTVTKMPVTLSGIADVTNEKAMTGGYDEETDEALRERYYNDLTIVQNGANANSYAKWALDVSGVGRVKVFPLAKGANTVEVCVIGSDMRPAAASLVKAVQDYIDPGITGSGAGVAPMGAYCTVSTATVKNINISCVVTLMAGYSQATVLANIKSKITAYLQSVAFVGTYVSYAKVADAVMSADGVSDYASLKVNGGIDNVSVGAREVAVLGTVDIGGAA